MKTMKKTMLLMLFPFLLMGQENEEWTTPMAHVGFNDGIPTYYYVISEASPLNPRMLLPEVFRIIPVPDKLFDHKVHRQSEAIVAGTLLAGLPGNAYGYEKEFYVRAFALQSVWGINEGMPPLQCRQTVEMLRFDPDVGISGMAAEACKLYDAITEVAGRPGSLLTMHPPRDVGQAIRGQAWPKYYGQPNRKDFSYDIIESYDKGYFILGGYNLNGGNPKFTWLIKTDVNGNILWEKIMQCTGFVKSFAMDPTQDGGLLISGLILLTNMGLDTYPLVVKLNSCGEKEWCKVFTGSTNNYPVAFDVQETSTGEAVVLVNMFGPTLQATMHLFKLDAWGNLLWKTPYAYGAGGGQPLGESILLTGNDDIIISGNIYWSDPWNPGGPMGIRPLFVRVDNMGNEEWVLPFGLQDTIYGDAYQTVQITNDLFLGVGNRWLSQNHKTGLFIEYNSEGAVLKYNEIDFTKIDSTYKDGVFINLIKQDTLFITGGGLGDFSQGFLTIGEIAFAENIFSPDYNVHFVRTDTNSSDPYSLEKTHDHKLLSNSTFNIYTSNWDIQLAKLNLNLEMDTLDPGNYTYDSLCIPGPPQSGVISLNACDIVTNMDEIPTPEEYYASLKTIPIKAYPNPVNGNEVTFGFENTEYHKNMELTCFNVFGDQVHNEKVYQFQLQCKVNVRDWRKGMYMALVCSNGGMVGQVKFIVY